MEVVELSTVDSIRRPVAAASESELETGPAAVELSGLVAASEDHTLRNDLPYQVLEELALPVSSKLTEVNC